jgi:hypothetical protein
MTLRSASVPPADSRGPRSIRQPMLRAHRGVGGAYVRWKGRQQYFGKAKITPAGGVIPSDAVIERHLQILREWEGETGCEIDWNKVPEAFRYGEVETKRRQAAEQDGIDLTRLPAPPPSEGLSVAELCAAYWKFAERYYRKRGKKTSYIYKVRAVIHWLDVLYGEMTAAAFDSLLLMRLQDSLASERDGKTGEAKYTRRYVNDLIGVVPRIFKWAGKQRLVPKTVSIELREVEPLEAWRSDAREPDPIKPIDDATVEATLAHLSPTIAAMVRFQRLTGCRPGEVCIVRPCDVDRGGAVWIYRPERHKSEHRKRVREIAIGPLAQAVLAPFLLRGQDDYCFVPAEAKAK